MHNVDSHMDGISVYLVNLPERVDRLVHSRIQFSRKSEFHVKIVSGEKRSDGLGLWKTIQKIIQCERDRNDDFFILCEDDHIFTEHYSPLFLCKCIKEAISFNADCLIGGCSWLECPIQLSENLFWVDKFTGMQFTVIFNNFYSKLLDIELSANSAVDLSISDISDDKFVIYPYISIQKEFGYSDLTPINCEKGYVSRSFTHTENKLSLLNKVKQYYLV